MNSFVGVLYLRLPHPRRAYRGQVEDNGPDKKKADQKAETTTTEQEPCQEARSFRPLR